MTILSIYIAVNRTINLSLLLLLFYFLSIIFLDTLSLKYIVILHLGRCLFLFIFCYSLTHLSQFLAYLLTFSLAHLLIKIFFPHTQDYFLSYSFQLTTSLPYLSFYLSFFLLISLIFYLVIRSIDSVIFYFFIHHSVFFYSTNFFYSLFHPFY